MKKYPYIVAWGQLMGSFGYYIVNECRKAEIANAPEDAYSFSEHKNEWSKYTTAPAEVKRELDAYKSGEKGGIISHY